MRTTGPFPPWTVLSLHIGFGLFMGFFAPIIWWLRTGEPIMDRMTIYPLLFGAYHASTAFVMHVAVLRRWATGGHRWMRIIAGTGVAMALFVLLRWLGDQLLLPWLGERPNYPETTGIVSFALDNVLYALLAIVYGALVFLAERQVQHQRMRAELAYRERLSELDLLRARMAPHFLYNTLNSLYALAIDGNEKLGPAILDLSELMRYIAKHQDEEVTLGTEMDQVERYIGSQRSRYVKPLQVSIEVDEASRSAGIPVMVLLPLIENAFKHGEPCDERMPVRLAARASEGTITITCTNRIAKEVGPREPGTGCHNLRRRLELLRGPNARAFFGPMDDRMYKAELVFPYTA